MTSRKSIRLVSLSSLGRERTLAVENKAWTGVAKAFLAIFAAERPGGKAEEFSTRRLRD